MHRFLKVILIIMMAAFGLVACSSSAEQSVAEEPTVGAEAVQRSKPAFLIAYANW